MNGYQFIASLVQSLAWPLAVAVVFWLFREEVRKIIPRMRVKYGEVDISVRLDEAEKTAKALPPPPPDAVPVQETKEERDKFEKIADLSPRAAILELRNELQGTLTDFGLSKGLLFKGAKSSFAYMVRALRAETMIDAETSALLDDLRVVGNTAAHDDRAEITRDEAMRFKTLVEVVVARLRAIQAGQIVPTRSAEEFYPSRSRNEKAPEGAE